MLDLYTGGEGGAVCTGVGYRSQVDDVAVQDLLISDEKWTKTINCENLLCCHHHNKQIHQQILTGHIPPLGLSAGTQRCTGPTGRSHPTTVVEKEKNELLNLTHYRHHGEIRKF